MGTRAANSPLAFQAGQRRQQLMFFLQPVHLVQRQDHPLARRPALLQQAALGRVLGPGIPGQAGRMCGRLCLDHQHHHVHLLQGDERLLDHEPVQGRTRLVHAGRVDEHHLTAQRPLARPGLGQRSGPHADDPVAGGLRARADDGQLLADDPVEQGRLAHVGAAHERHRASHWPGHGQARLLPRRQLAHLTRVGTGGTNHVVHLIGVEMVVGIVGAVALGHREARSIPPRCAWVLQRPTDRKMQ